MLRDAASLILYKEEDGLRVLMGIRHAGHKFMPNCLVFPGGRVDAEDYGAPAASALPQAAMARLELAASPALAAALGHAAARELEEETGLSLGCPPALAGLDYLCRAETPVTYTTRFNARFFMAKADTVQGDIAGSGELEGLAWYALDTLSDQQVPEVTRLVLQQLQHWLGLDENGRAKRASLVYRDPDWLQD